MAIRRSLFSLSRILLCVAAPIAQSAFVRMFSDRSGSGSHSESHKTGKVPSMQVINHFFRVHVPGPFFDLGRQRLIVRYEALDVIDFSDVGRTMAARNPRDLDGAGG